MLHAGEDRVGVSAAGWLRGSKVERKAGWRSARWTLGLERPCPIRQLIKEMPCGEDVPSGPRWSLVCPSSCARTSSSHLDVFAVNRVFAFNPAPAFHICYPDCCPAPPSSRPSSRPAIVPPCHPAIPPSPSTKGVSAPAHGERNCCHQYASLVARGTKVRRVSAPPPLTMLAQRFACSSPSPRPQHHRRRPIFQERDSKHPWGARLDDKYFCAYNLPVPTLRLPAFLVGSSTTARGQPFITFKFESTDKSPVRY